MSKKGYLTAEEYRAIRTALGFTQVEAQAFHRVQNVRTIKNWEKGTSFVSELACDKIVGLFKQVNKLVYATEDKITEHFNSVPKKDWQTAVLIQYPDSCYKQFVFDIGDLPNSIHKKMIERIYTDLTEEGYPVGIIMFNAADYFTFLSANGLQDCHESRSAWATAAYRSNKS